MPCHTAPPIACNHSDVVSMHYNSLFTGVLQCSTYAHRECAAKVIQRDPGTWISRVVKASAFVCHRGRVRIAARSERRWIFPCTTQTLASVLRRDFVDERRDEAASKRLSDGMRLR